MAHLHLNELSLICDMWLNKITYLLTYLLTLVFARLVFKSECECDLWRPPLLETIGLSAGRVLCILVIVKNYGILGDFDLNWATCKSFVISL